MPTFNTTDPKPGYVYDSSNDTWYPLVGIAPASQVDRWTKTAAGGETSLSGNDDNAVSLSYTSGTEQVYLNGVLLVRGQDYTATNGTTITGLSALTASDVAEVVTFNPSNILTTDAVLSTDFDAKGDLISASAASTPIRVPVGTDGYVLKANSATTSGLEWAASAADIEGVTAGTGISGGGTSGTVTITNSMATAIDAKGDLIAGTAADTFSRLAVGTNGQVLTAASGEATGLQWATPSAGGMTLLSTTTLSGATTTISSIDQTYTCLHVNIVGIVNATRTKYRIRPNAATNLAVYGGRTANSGNPATVNGYQAGSAEAIAMNDYSTIAATGGFNCWTFTIENYSSSSTPKNFLLYGSWFGDDESSMIYTGQIRTSSAISSLVIAADAGSMTAGTVLIYGVK